MGSNPIERWESGEAEASIFPDADEGGHEAGADGEDHKAIAI